MDKTCMKALGDTNFFQLMLDTKRYYRNRFTYSSTLGNDNKTLLFVQAEGCWIKSNKFMIRLNSCKPKS